MSEGWLEALRLELNEHPSRLPGAPLLMDEAIAQLRGYREDVQKLRAMLQRVMWQKDREDKPRSCALCGGRRVHVEGCELAALLNVAGDCRQCPNCDEHVAQTCVVMLASGRYDGYVCPALPDGTVLLLVRGFSGPTGGASMANELRRLRA